MSVTKFILLPLVDWDEDDQTYNKVFDAFVNLDKILYLRPHRYSELYSEIEFHNESRLVNMKFEELVEKLKKELNNESHT
jgi:hypothetical protein